MNPCGVAHFANAPCRECERLRKKDATANTNQTPLEAKAPVRNAQLYGQSSTSDLAKVVKETAPLTPAQKQRQYRERRKAADPNWLAKEAARRAAKRKKIQ